MKTTRNRQSSIKIAAMLLCLICGSINVVLASNQTPSDTTTYSQFNGSVVDSKSGEILIYTSLNIINTNIATISNSEGNFKLKVPKNLIDQSIQISFIGYQTKVLKIKELNPSANIIKLDPISVSLAEINVFPKDPNYLIRAVLEKIKDNYIDEPILMTSFYRETIKLGRKYVSLSEAVVDVVIQPATSNTPENIKLIKARKNVDYTKLDTLTFKLMGGPYSALMLDFTKDPYIVLTDNMFHFYNFKLDNITRINDRLIYVLEFKEKPYANQPLYSGKLYIDSESLAITNAVYSLNISNKSSTTNMFIKKKPMGANVYPTEATYMVNYSEKDGKWFYSYSRGQLNFRVNWNKKMLNSNYLTTFEMANTDWIKANETKISNQEKLKSTSIMEDEATNFADEMFWGKYNVIEPEESIETAIKKIQKNLDELNK